MLHRTLSVQKWASLVLLTFGVALVQLPTTPVPKQESFFQRHFRSSKGAETLISHATGEERMNSSFGLVAVLAACMLSGLAGVYFEKVLKGSSATLWIRNVQLSFFSLFPALFLGVLWKDGHEVLEKVGSQVG
jgi:solute carrier family 35 (UDP-sugar transporter), member A1/2/3